MFRRIIFSALALVSALALPVFAQTQTFTHTARIVMGSRETQDECREFAKVEARRAVLDQVGVYIEGRSDLMQHIRESAAGLTDTTDMQKRVLAIAAGVTQLEVAGEEWKSEGGALVLYLTCRVMVNPDDVAQRLTEMVKDRQKVEDYERVQTEVARLREELARLRADLDSAKNEAQTNATRESVKGAINELTANDWFEKGLAATEADDQIACYSFSLQLDPSLDGAYNNRGSAYVKKGDYDRAIADFSRALQIVPNNALAYNNRGAAYNNKGDLDRAMTDFNRTLEIDPNCAKAYYNRGTVYGKKGDHDRAIADISRALQIDPNGTDVYYNRGLSYYAKGDFDRAIADFSRALRVDSNDDKAYYWRGQAYISNGNQASAVLDIRRAAGLGNEKAKRWLEEMR